MLQRLATGGDRGGRDGADDVGIRVERREEEIDLVVFAHRSLVEDVVVEDGALRRRRWRNDVGWIDATRRWQRRQIETRRRVVLVDVEFVDVGEEDFCRRCQRARLLKRRRCRRTDRWNERVVERKQRRR